MTGLFYSFDFFSALQTLNWIIGLPILMSCVFMKNAVHRMKHIMFTPILFQESKTHLGNSFMPGSPILFISIFILIFSMNFTSLWGYVFPLSAHICMALAMGMSLWLMSVLMSTLNPKKVLSHLVPPGTPPYLISFMTFIEMISILIRPITLSVRLVANITAGHILLALISWSNKMIFGVILMQMPMMFLEILVSVIQAYVFFMLTMLYMNEMV